MGDADATAEFLVDGKPVFDDDGNRLTTKNAYKKYVAKKEKDAKKAAYKADKAPAGGVGGGGGGGAAAEEAVSIGPVTYFKDEPVDLFGDLVLVQSNQSTGRVFTHVSNLTAAGYEGNEVWIRARVHNTRSKGNNCFLVLRQSGFTVQGAMFKSDAIPKEMIKFSGALSKETIVDVKDTDGSTVRVKQDIRLDNRVLDMRVPAQNAIMRINSAVCHYFRGALLEKGFVEIHTPKMIAGASEGGAEVFKFKYMEGTRFERQACLAQSPQLYKQMAIMGDLERVFEVGPVFRAENSHSGRHLTEFTGLDFEMEIKESYTEALDMTDYFMVKIFDGIKANFQQELKIISQQYPFEPLQYSSGKNFRMSYPEGLKMLREAGMKNEDGSEVIDTQDLSTPLEKKLGELVKAQHGTDFWALDQYPTEVRPFYTMPCAHDARYTNSYDVFMRGQEIMSGAQRVHTTDLLTSNCIAKGVDPADLAPYIDAFKYGASPHAGGGIGLERVVALYLGLDNVRKTSMFPRDPTRLTP